MKVVKLLSMYFSQGSCCFSLLFSNISLIIVFYTLLSTRIRNESSHTQNTTANTTAPYFVFCHTNFIRDNAHSRVIRSCYYGVVAQYPTVKRDFSLFRNVLLYAWAPSSLLFNCTSGNFPGIERPKREANDISLFSTQFNWLHAKGKFYENVR